MVRKAALKTLIDINTGSGALREHLEFDARDKAFYVALVETTLDDQTTIDAVISAYSKTRLKKIDTTVLNAIRMAVAQVFYMDRVPDSAACNESVNLIRECGKARLSGFANGLIRNIIREKSAPSARIVLSNNSIRLKYNNGHWQVNDSRYRQYEKLLDLSLTYSYPYWIVEHLEKSYGDAGQILKGLRSRRKISALVNTKKIHADDADRFQTLEFDRLSDPPSNPEFQAGEFYIMDPSSMQPMLQAGDGLHGKDVLDLCAAPGGKSIETAILYDSHVTACDVTRTKTDKIRENIRRLGLESYISVMENDATVYNVEFVRKYDAVIADAPCSALGVSGRKPEIRLRLTPDDFISLSIIQQKILENASKYLNGNGILIYSTCTLDPLENEEQVSKFLKEHSDFELIKQHTIIPDNGHDGFYYAIMRNTK